MTSIIIILEDIKMTIIIAGVLIKHLIDTHNKQQESRIPGRIRK